MTRRFGAFSCITKGLKGGQLVRALRQEAVLAAAQVMHKLLVALFRLVKWFVDQISSVFDGFCRQNLRIVDCCSFFGPPSLLGLGGAGAALDRTLTV